MLIVKRPLHYNTIQRDHRITFTICTMQFFLIPICVPKTQTGSCYVLLTMTPATIAMP
jgi:hypothetical protein